MVKSMVKKYYQPTIDKIEEQVLAVHEKYKAYDLDAEDISLIEDDGGSSVNSSSTKGSISTVNSQKYESARQKRLREEKEARIAEKDKLKGERDEILQDLKKQMDDVTYLSEKYYLSDAAGKRVLNIESNKHRMVWSECSERNDYYLEILPANGTYMDNQEENEMSYQNDDEIMNYNDNDEDLRSGYGGDEYLSGNGNGEVPGYDSDDECGTGGSKFGIMPLPSVMSDKMVPSIT